METPLLRTKLHIPPPRPKLVPRPRLIERLNAGLHRKLTLISAPAGFGKTTLVSEWVSDFRLSNLDFGSSFAEENPIQNRQSEIQNRVAWLSLDESDNDLTRFLIYLIGALQTVDGDIGKGVLNALQSPQPPPAEETLTALINEVAILTDRIVLVLDDYHLIDTQPIHDAFAFLLRRLPPNMHLVIATREDPLLPLARLRARGQLTELRAMDLRFTPSEAAEFLNQVMGLALSAEDIAALGTRTEGWIAGLQLAAASMQGREDLTGFIQSFTGSHHFVLDYLVEEVLEQQSGSIRDFLLQTAILDRLTGSLCDALTGQEDGQATLEMLERTNLFIISLDEERRWYRYHHLFAELLRQRLRQTQPEQVSMLHIRASEWYEQNGLTDEAIEYALRAEEFEQAVSLIEERGDALWGQGEHGKLRRWLDRLPDELLLSKPQFGLLQAWLQCISGRLDAAERILEVTEPALYRNADRIPETEPQRPSVLTHSERQKLRGRAAAIRAVICSHQGDVPGIIQYAHQAQEYLPKEDQFWCSNALVLDNAYGFKGDMMAAYKARFETLKACEAGGDVYLVMIANLQLAITLRTLGRLQQTIEICQQQYWFATESGMLQTPAIGWLLAVWGETLAELDDLDKALDRAKKGFRLVVRGRHLQMVGWSFMCLIRVLLSRGNLAEAQETIQEMEQISREFSLPPWTTAQMAAWQTRLWLAQDKLGAASQWAREHGLAAGRELEPLQEIGYFLLLDYLVLTRVLIAQGRLNEATQLLQHLIKAAEAGGRDSEAIEILILQALAFQAGDDTDQAITALEKAFTLAEPEGFFRIFVDEGPPMARLLYEALSRGIAPDYVRRLLSAFPMTEACQSATPENEAAESKLIESLSEREIEVLHLIGEGLTNREIASRLFLTLNTVKAHSRNIYGKLDVHSRTQAIARAQALGLLLLK